MYSFELKIFNKIKSEQFTAVTTAENAEKAQNTSILHYSTMLGIKETDLEILSIKEN